MGLEVVARVAPIRIDDHGVARVGDTRVTLDVVIYAFREGASAEAIVDRYDSLSLADAYSAIAFYLQNTAEVDEYIRGREGEARALRAEIERHYPSHGLREKILVRRAAGERTGA